MNNFTTKLVEDLKKQYLWLIFTFMAYVAATLLATYLYEIPGVQPSVIFNPQGISLAAFIMLGYIAAIPLGLATIVFGYMNGMSAILIVSNSIGSLIAPALSLFLLRRLGFKRTLESTRDFLVFLGVIAATSAIGPTLFIYMRGLLGPLVGANPLNLSWMNIWVAGLVSSMVLTPFILRWAVPIRKRSIGEWIEIISISTLFLVTNYVISWTPYTTILGVNLAIFYFVLLLWIALRAGTRFMTLAMVGSIIISISGLFLGHAVDTSAQPLSVRIFSDEILFVFMAFFFYMFCAIEENRRTAVRKLNEYSENLTQSLETKELDSEAKNEFIAILGHEIRNPLASLLSSVEIMKFNKNEAESERQLESMEDRIRSMGRLLDDIFDISRITRKKLILRKEVARARDVLRRATEGSEAYLAKSRHRFNVTLPDKNVLIHADPVRIEQVITNLLYNAAKYTPAGGSIDFKSTFENGQLVIRVRDTGVGLTEEEQEKIFEPFVQVNPRQSLMGGVGLGLTLSKNLVEMHAGTIEVQSDGLGRGSEFIVRLPAAIGHASEKKAAPEVVKPIGSRKILVVDDNVDAARGMGKLLELHGHDVEIAHNGTDALAKAETHQPSGIVLDIGLPDMDGYEVARRLRESKNESVLIALSGYGQDEHRKKARAAGFDFYLTKPVSITEVVQIVDSSSKTPPAHQNKVSNLKRRSGDDSFDLPR